MNKKELIEEISRHTGISRREVQAITNHLTHNIIKSLSRDSKVSLRGFGSFNIVNTHERHYNIFTRSIEEHQTRRVKFRPSRNFKELVNHPKDTYTKATSVFPVHKSNSQVCTINEGKLNLGQRREKAILDNPTTIEYHGKVSIDRFLGTLEHTLYPSIKTPQLGTSILMPQKISRGPVIGITEPLFLKRLTEFCRDNTGLKLMENVAVPIKDWHRSYIPDFVLYHVGANLYIDVEIDEPYDSKNRKPIHFIGGNDVNRDNYLISNGWIVIRYSERQIYNQLEEVIEDLHSKICWLEGVNCCPSPLSIENRWTYNEAEVFAKENLREQYLGIDILQHGDSIETSDDDELNKEIHQYGAGLKLEGICILLKDSIINQIDYILSVKPRYVRVTLKDSRQVILDGNSFRVELVDDLESRISGNCPFRYAYRPIFKNSEISKIEPLSNLYTDIYWKSGKSELSERRRIRTILINAALEGSPLWIRYKYRRWKDPEAIEYESFASCIYLSNSEPNREGTPRYRPSLTKPFIDMGAFTVGGAIYLNGYGINPYFNISASHILEVKVINCTKCYYNIEVYKNSLSELVLNPYNYPLNYKVKVDTLIAQKANFDIDNLLYKKLIAHYETIKGNTELALNYYLAVNYETMVKFDTEELKWGETCVKDINSYINLTKNLKHWSSSYELNPDTVLQNFMSVKGLLIESGWKWE